MKYFEVEALDINEAINKISNTQRLPKEFIQAEVISEGTKGFLGIGKKNGLYKIKFDNVEFIKRKAKYIVSEIIEKMGIEDFRIEISDNYPNFRLNIFSQDSSILIGKIAQTLNAIQNIVDKMLGLEDESDIIITVDVENYRERMLSHLKDKANILANNVKKTGKPAKMPPMVTMIRREIHLVLKEIRGVRSESYGNGDIKTIFIVPEKDKRRRERRHD